MIINAHYKQGEYRPNYLHGWKANYPVVSTTSRVSIKTKQKTPTQQQQ